MIRSQTVTHLVRLALPPVGMGIAYYIAAVVSLFLTRGQDGIAMLWPASGILFAALLVVPPQRAGWFLATAAMASFAANLGSGNAVVVSIGFTVANMTESAFAAWLVRTRGKCRVSFVNPRGLTCFCMAATLATMLSATMATIMAPIASIDVWLSWFSTDLLGLLVVTPMIMIVGRALYRNGLGVGLRAAAGAMGVFAIVGIVAGVTFSQSSYPLLFMPMLAVLIAAFRLGPLGAAGGVLIVAIVSSIAIIVGVGPQSLIRSGPIARSLFMQFYLLALFAAALPVATLLAARQQLLDRLATKMRLLQLAESAANVGHWRLNIAAQTVTWSEQVFRIHGRDGDVPLSVDAAIDAYHPDDQDRVAALIERAIEQRHGFEFTARLVRPDGEVRHVFSKGEIDCVGEDESIGLFGIIQDVTTQVAHEAAIQGARVRAEAAAREATILAETDLLTGIANRRRTTFALDQAVLASRQTKQPVSIAMFDVDHFKRINDTYGHQAGDEVLKRIAVDAAGELRTGDTAGRFGGEEFVIVLPDATAQTAMMVAERIRLRIECESSIPRVTISVGVAELLCDESTETLLKRADQALYAAKNSGRNMSRLAA
ncbi:sensor domain-containing diguanylate cyclase [Sphingomonas sp. UV9]|uniref:sensor domain-containing diguanylate cyclase n=1 Tax=Sphingomonas sp. UV9 TaxID=1851410 RepID=UPI000FFCA576|nr:sensor domain-containing diguanylate cyclase [Sphingomonas sp. UV9]RXD07303.1 sensor domain-containing diguanylate cyclase [Sphingomonas sp. UV9]